MRRFFLATLFTLSEISPDAFAQPDGETIAAQEIRLHAAVAALAPDDFSPAAEAVRMDYAALLVFGVERDFETAIALLAPLLARAPADPALQTRARAALGTACSYLNRHQEAMALLEAVRDDSAARLGADHPETLVDRGNLASAYARAGRPDLAEPELREIARIFTARDPDSDDALHARTEWSISLGRIGRWHEMETVLRDVIARRTRLLGPDDPRLAHQLSLFTWVLYSTKRESEAVPLLRHVVAIRTAELGPAAAKTLTARFNLASALLRLGAFDEAESLLHADRDWVAGQPAPGERALADYDARLGRLYSAKGNLPAALDYLRHAAGALEKSSSNNDDPKYRDTLADLVRAEIAVGETSSARATLERWFDQQELLFQRRLAYTSETERLALLRNERPFDLPAMVGSPELLARASLRFKHLILDSLLEDAAAAGNPGAYRTALQQSGDESHANPLHLSTREAAERDLALRTEAITRTREVLQTDPRAVLDHLPATAALIDYVRYRHDLPGSAAEERYAALVGTRDGWRSVPLGPASVIDAAIDRYEILVARTGELSWARDVRRLVIDPLLPLLSRQTETLFISPDSRLHGISFAMLPADTPGGWLGGAFTIALVASGRDLLPRASEALPSPMASPAALIFAAPENLAPPHDRLPPLSGAPEEGEALRQLLQPAELLSGTDATPAALRRHPSPRILHLAAHAVALPGHAAAGHGTLQRHGLVLAGHDGFLDARQSAALDLRATGLVFINGCATGGGTLADNEGVLGLRRGFMRAGVKTLVFTLWPVVDDDARHLTLAFYRHWLAGKNPAAALRAAQHELAAKLAGEGATAVEILRRAGAHLISVRH